MTTYNTGNPIGSKDPRDLYDNAENLDTAVNDINSDTWTDRLGRSRKTMSGMEREFDVGQALREHRFNTFLESSGYQFLGDYAAGIEITEYNQLIRDSNGEFWRLSGQVELPYTTTGDWGEEESLFVAVGDAALRQELASPDKGALMVRGAVIYVDTIADLQAMDTSSLVDGQQVQVKEYHAGTGVGGGEFYWDALSTETENGGTVFGSYAKGRWRRIIRGELLATYFGAIPDADPSTYTGTDNSDVQLAVDEYAYQAGYTIVYWPEGVYRFTQPLQRKVAHYGKPYNEYINPSVTFILDNPSPTTWLTGKGVGPFKERSHDIRNITFISAQDRIHTLFDGHGYKLLIENCTFRRFDVVFDVEGVYVWWSKCHFHTVNTGIYPRPLGSGHSSTMFSLDHCVFYNYNIAFHHEDRGLGTGDPYYGLMSLKFNHCGFEKGLDSGIKIEERVWYLNTINCWSELNGVAGVNITVRGTDWTDTASRWDDVVIDQTMYGVLRVGPTRFQFGSVHHPFKTHRVRGTLSSSIHIKNTGEIRYSDFPATASVDSGVFQVDFPLSIQKPVISVTPYMSHRHLSYSIRLVNTGDPDGVEAYASVNRIEIKFFDPTDPSTLITPYWCAISLSWPSGENAPNPIA